MKFKETALILAGHGSTKNKDSSRHTRETAKRLQKRGIFKEVRAGFWKESPSFQEVFHGLEAKEAIVVPWFLTRGYFVEKVLSEQFAATPIPTRIVDPIGARPEVLQLMKKRAEKLARSQLKFKFKLKRAIEGLLRFSKPEEDGFRLEETSLLLASHGTPLHKGSRVAADGLAEELAKDGYRVSRAMFPSHDTRRPTRKRPVMRERRAECVIPGESLFLGRMREIRMPAVPNRWSPRRMFRASSIF